MIQIKRAYEKPSPSDGVRILVDRLWPRGMTKDEAKIDRWAKDLAPSSELRKFYCHDVEKWDEFKRLYHEELRGKKDELEELAKQAKHGHLTLVYGAKDEQHNQAIVLLEAIQKL